MKKPRTHNWWPAFSEIDEILGKLELNFLKRKNQNEISDVKFIAKFLFVVLQKN